MSDDKIEPTKEKIQGAVDEAKGRVKDAVGGLTGDAKMQASGKVDQLAGIAQEEFADLYEESQSIIEKSVACIRDKPLLSLGIAYVAGVVVTWLLFPRRRKA